MPKTDTVPVFYLNQDETFERPCRIFTRKEARKAKGILGSFILHGTAFRLFERCTRTEGPDYVQSSDASSSCSISVEEMQANVGIAGMSGDPPLQYEVCRAQEKVRAYPHVHDTRAVTANNRWLRSPILISVNA